MVTVAESPTWWGVGVGGIGECLGRSAIKRKLLVSKKGRAKTVVPFRLTEAQSCRPAVGALTCDVSFLMQTGEHGRGQNTPWLGCFRGVGLGGSEQGRWRDRRRSQNSVFKDYTK